MTEEIKANDEGCCGHHNEEKPQETQEKACCCGGECGLLRRIPCVFKTFFWITAAYVLIMAIMNWVIVFKTAAAGGPVNYQIGVLSTLYVLVAGAIVAGVFLFISELSKAVLRIEHELCELKGKLENK